MTSNPARRFLAFWPGCMAMVRHLSFEDTVALNGQVRKSGMKTEGGRMTISIPDDGKGAELALDQTRAALEKVDAP
jgi:hypothetical protein